MSDYLHNLAAMAVHPGGGVQPRLPGRFEAQHLALADQIDSMAADEAASTKASGADRHEPAPSATPAHASVDLGALSASAAAPADRPRHRQVPAIAPSPLVANSQPPRTEAAQLWAEPGTPTVSGKTSPAVQPTITPPAAEKGKGSTAPVKTRPVSSAPRPAPISPATDSAERRPSMRRRPDPVLPSDSPRSIRIPPSTIAPAAQAADEPTAVPEPSASVRPNILASEPLALESTSRFPAGWKLPDQSEPDAPPAEMAPATPKLGQKTPAEPMLGWVDGKPTVEPYFMEPIVDEPLRQAGPEPAPTIRVTIGRIEVRAIMPSAAPPRVQPVRRQPALPLDQYLQRRSEGKR